MHSVRVSLEDNSAHVEYDAGLLDREEIINSITEAGFEASLDSSDGRRGRSPTRHTRKSPTRLDANSPFRNTSPSKLSYLGDVLNRISSPFQNSMADGDLEDIRIVNVLIQFMTCQSCVKSITKALESTPGISSAAIDLETETGIIQISNEMDPKIVVQVIEDAGFEASILQTDSSSKEIPAFKTRNNLVNPFISPIFQQSLTEIQMTPIKNSDKVSNTRTSLFRIKGMTCASCVASIENRLNSKSEIVFATIALVTEQASVEYIPKLITKEEICKLIDDLGFEATSFEPPRTGVIDLQVYGMTCGSCSGSIERELRKLPGIESVSVNLLGQTAHIIFIEGVIGIRDMVERIESIGFNALLADSSSTSQIDSLSRTKEIMEWKSAFWTSLCFAVPVTFISMVLPHFAPNFVNATVFVQGLLLGDLIQMILTAPVQFWIGWRFYKAAFKALSHSSYTMDVLITLGTTMSFAFSAISIIHSISRGGNPRPDVFFETSSTLITFVTLGRF